jgi:hypothetical protein
MNCPDCGGSVCTDELQGFEFCMSCGKVVRKNVEPNHVHTDMDKIAEFVNEGAANVDPERAFQRGFVSMENNMPFTAMVHWGMGISNADVQRGEEMCDLAAERCAKYICDMSKEGKFTDLTNIDFIPRSYILLCGDSEPESEPILEFVQTVIRKSKEILPEDAGPGTVALFMANLTPLYISIMSSDTDIRVVRKLSADALDYATSIRERCKNFKIMNGRSIDDEVDFFKHLLDIVEETIACYSAEKLIEIEEKWYECEDPEVFPGSLISDAYDTHSNCTSASIFKKKKMYEHFKFILDAYTFVMISS